MAASFDKILALIAKNVDEARLAVLNEIQDYILGELDEASRQDMKDLFDRFKTEKFQAKTEVALPAKKGKRGAKKVDGGEKKPKKATAYQMFSSEKMKELKGNPDVEAKNRMAHIGALWKAMSAAEKDVYQKQADSKNAPVVDVETEAVDEE